MPVPYPQRRQHRVVPARPSGRVSRGSRVFLARGAAQESSTREQHSRPSRPSPSRLLSGRRLVDAQADGRDGVACQAGRVRRAGSARQHSGWAARCPKRGASPRPCAGVPPAPLFLAAGISGQLVLIWSLQRTWVSSGRSRCLHFVHPQSTRRPPARPPREFPPNLTRVELHRLHAVDCLYVHALALDALQLKAARALGAAGCGARSGSGGRTSSARLCIASADHAHNCVTPPSATARPAAPVGGPPTAHLWNHACSTRCSTALSCRSTALPLPPLLFRRLSIPAALPAWLCLLTGRGLLLGWVPCPRPQQPCAVA